MKKVYLLAVIMAVVVGMAVFFFATTLEQKAQSRVVDTNQVVVAVADIPANTLITADMVTITQLPVQSINALSADNLQDVVGMISKYPIAPQEQVLTTRLNELGSAESNNTLSYVLEDGYRAVSFGVDDVSGISGYITKGDHVDVVAIVTYPTDGDTAEHAVSTLLVENLLVLETGVKETGAAESAAANYTTVTLSATPEDILKISYAATNGKILLMLRPVLDKASVTLPDFPVINQSQSTTPSESVDPVVGEDAVQ